MRVRRSYQEEQEEKSMQNAEYHSETDQEEEGTKRRRIERGEVSLQENNKDEWAAIKRSIRREFEAKLSAEFKQTVKEELIADQDLRYVHQEARFEDYKAEQEHDRLRDAATISNLERDLRNARNSESRVGGEVFKATRENEHFRLCLARK